MPGKAGARAALVPSPKYLAVADAVVAGLQRVSGSTSFVSVHPRLEQDFVVACDKWRGSPGWQAFDGKVMSCLDDEAPILAALREHGVPCGSPAMVMSGTASLVAGGLANAMPVLCGAACGACSESCYHIKCYSRDEVWQRTSDVADMLQRGMVDYMVAQRSSAFFGNFYSTMSQELYYRHKAAGRPAYFYNRRL